MTSSAKASGNPEAIKQATDEYLRTPKGIEKLKESGQLDVARKYELERAEQIRQGKAVETLRHALDEGQRLEAGLSHSGSDVETLPPAGYNTSVSLAKDDATGRFNASVVLTPPEVSTKEFSGGMEAYLLSQSKEARDYLDVLRSDLPDPSGFSVERFSRLVSEANERTAYERSLYTAGSVYASSEESSREQTLAEYRSLKEELDDAKEDGFNGRPEDYQRLDSLRDSLLSQENPNHTRFDPALQEVSFEAQPYFTEPRVREYVNNQLRWLANEYSDDAEVQEWCRNHPLAETKAD